jgi:hypothetical protein
MKLVISKSKDGKGYYTKIQNDYNDKHIEKYLSISVPKGTEIEYGLYDVDGFLSVYEKKDGTAEFKLVVTNINTIKQYDIPTEKLTTKTETQTQFDYSDSDLPF